MIAYHSRYIRIPTPEQIKLAHEAERLQRTLYQLSLRAPARYKPAFFSAMRRWKRRLAC